MANIIVTSKNTDIENILYTYKFNIKTIISSVTSTIV